MVSGRDALRALEYLCSAKVDRPVGTCIYSLMLNSKGGVEADLVVTRKSPDAFYLTVGSATTRYVIRNDEFNKCVCFDSSNEISTGTS